MTAPEFADEHGDPAHWTPVEVEIWEHLAEADQAPVACWFCTADNPPNYTTCGFCNHHVADNPATQTAA